MRGPGGSAKHSGEKRVSTPFALALRGLPGDSCEGTT
jgi:hypothetical protein